jgi:hypothetical protein
VGRFPALWSESRSIAVARDGAERDVGRVVMFPASTPREIIRRVRGEFLEMPGLKLTVAQAQRLWGADRTTCEAVIEALTRAQFLVRTRDGAVVRRASTSA